jgi:putative methyltransferase (TIGR04325 family)
MATDVTEFYADFAQAAEACGDGYATENLAKVVAFKTMYIVAQDEKFILPEQAINTIVALGACISEVSEHPLRALDFGGGCGFHYFMARRAIKTAMRWAVVETEIMTKEAQQLASEGLEFHTTIDSAKSSLGKVDFVHTSGTIQYLPDPMQTLEALLAVDAPYFALARFPLWPEQATIGVQPSMLSLNGLGPMPPGISEAELRYPVTFLNIEAVMAKFVHYELILSLSSPSGSYNVRGKLAPGLTLVFRNRRLSD